MMKTLFSGLVILFGLLLWADVDATMTCPVASCKYVRPSQDEFENDLNYGAEDGSDEANAFDGPADISGLVPGDTVCFPGSDEPFTAGELLDAATVGTAAARITYVGCGADKTLFWPVSNLSGERSFNASRVLVTGDSSYNWEALGHDIYKKKIGVRANQLWEDETWLQGYHSSTHTEAQILAEIQPGQWTNRDNGDSTFRIYYRATASPKNPANTTIRSNNITRSATGNPILRIGKSYITFRNLEVRGWNSPVSSSPAMRIFRGSHLLLDDVKFNYNKEPFTVEGLDTAITDIELRDVESLNNLINGVRVDPNHPLDADVGTVWISDLRFIRGKYNGTMSTGYTGTATGTGDGDGIGIGFAGGRVSDVLMEGIEASGNFNRGTFSGTTDANYFLTNWTIKGARMDSNGRGCISEGTDAEVLGTWIISGLVCTNSRNVVAGVTYHPAIHFSSSWPANAAGAFADPGTRQVYVLNSTFLGNLNNEVVNWEGHARNHIHFTNNVFWDNPGNSLTRNGDLYTINGTLQGIETFDNNWFASRIGLTSPFATLGGVTYAYDSADSSAFDTATGAVNTTLNADPSVRWDGKTNGNSPLRRAGTPDVNCVDARVRPCWAPPDIGGYQATHGDFPN